jgi:hypothetical protein
MSRENDVPKGFKGMVEGGTEFTSPQGKKILLFTT